MVSPRPNRLYCSTACRIAAFERRRVEEATIAQIDSQLGNKQERILVNGKLMYREAAWAYAEGLRLTRSLEGAEGEGQTVHRAGSWWVHVRLPLGRFPG